MEGMVENFAAMMAGSLGLTEPWYAERAYFAAEEMAVHIHADVRKTAMIACPVCGSETKRYGYEKNERVWRHGDCLFYLAMSIAAARKFFARSAVPSK